MPAKKQPGRPKDRPHKKTMGRPVQNKLPPRIDATPEDIAKAFFKAGPTKSAARNHRCMACEEEVHYPDVLYQDGRCAKCRAAA